MQLEFLIVDKKLHAPMFFVKLDCSLVSALVPIVQHEPVLYPQSARPGCTGVIYYDAFEQFARSMLWDA